MNTIKSFFPLVLIALFMTLTRGSHFLNSVSLPDASFALFLIGGLVLRNSKSFFSLLIFSLLIDLVTLSIDNNYQISIINIGYIGLLISYGILWFTGYCISIKKNFLRFTSFSFLATLLAILISTQTFNFFSGRFPNMNIKQSIQIGWEYLPQTLLYTMAYLILYWAIQSLFKRQFVSQKANVL